MKTSYLQISLFVFLFHLCFYEEVFSQDWVEKMDNVKVSFYQVQNEFNSYWNKRPIERGKGWKAYKRWEWFMESRVYPSGNRTEMSQAISNYYEQSKQQKRISTTAGNWSLIGPSTIPTGGGGAGRINFITFHPNDTNTFYVGAPGGGLWSTSDGGNSWTTQTDKLEVIGVSDLVINPENPDVMYLASGDGDGGATYSIGVLKSTDGGNTWNASGLSWAVSAGYNIYKLEMHPNDTSKLFAVTNGGIYRSADAGDSWSVVQTGSFKDLEFNPTDPTIVYACGNQFYKSIDGGIRFSQITSGLPSSSVINRMAIATTEANSDYVYVLAASGSSGDYGFYGFYKSSDKGSTFSTQASSPNLLGWDSNGSDNGGQGWYDLSIIASPTNADEVYTGGVNIWKTTDGGINWTINSHWYGQYGNPYVHADIHNIEFNPNDISMLFACSDGGLFITTNNGTTWKDISDGLAIRQSYRIGLSATNVDLLLSGNQDNGTDAYRSGLWSRVLGGDGMECIVDYSDEKYMYGEYYYGSILRSVNGGISFSGITNGITETGAWVTPFIMDPTDSRVLYAGFSNVWKTSNRGDSWTAISNFGSSSTLNALAVAPSNTDYIYAASYSKLYKTTDGGASWTDISSGLPVSSAAITYIAVDPANPDHIYATFSGYVSGKKVYESSNGGSSWNNISGSLPNLPVNCIVYEKGSSDAIYIGNDIGVYYIDNSLSDWISFSTNLPSVVVNELEIHYSSATIKAATFGRGIWESDLFSAQTMAPLADFSSSETEVCPGESVQFTDMSSYAPTSWNWTFQGGMPSSSTDQHPIINFSTEGVFDVSLEVTNSNGTNTTTQTAYIKVGSQVLPFQEDLNSSSFPPDNWEIINDDNDLTWDQESVLSADGTTSSCAFMNFYNYSSTGTKDDFISPSLDFSLYSDSVFLSFNVAYCSYGSGYDDGLNVYISTDCGLTYDSIPIYSKSGSTLQTTTSSSTEYYPSNANQWRNEIVDLSSYAGRHVLLKFEGVSDYGNNLFLDDINVITYDSASVSIYEITEQNSLKVYPNPSTDLLYLELTNNNDAITAIELSDLNGKIIFINKEDKQVEKNKSFLAINSFSNGIYFLKIETTNEIFNRKIVIEKK